MLCSQRAAPCATALLLCVLAGGCGADTRKPDKGVAGAGTAGEGRCAPEERCRADMAEWPMPGTRPGGKLVPFDFEGLDDPERDTVLDRVTLLEWERHVPFDMKLSYAEAEDYCAGLTLAEHDDWRVPSRVELDTLFDPTRPAQNAAMDIFGDASPARLLWSSTPSLRTAGNQLIVVENGLGFHDEPDAELKVRCVRWTGPPRSDAPRYSVRGTVTEPITHDERTGLDWQQKVPTEGLSTRPGIVLRGLTHEAAVSYCADLSYGGHADWRLPNLKEAVTLFDPTQRYRLSPDGFPGEVVVATWTSSEDPDPQGWYWYSQGDFYGSGETSQKVDARCVR